MNYGRQSVHEAKRALDRTVAELLLVAEAMLVTQRTSQTLARGATPEDAGFSGGQQSSAEEAATFRRCPNCFPLIAVDVILNSTLHPFVIEVICQPNMQKSGRDGDAVSSKVKQTVLADMFNLLAADATVVSDVSEALEEVIADNNIGVMGANCQISHEVCLSQDDLNYLLQSRREDLHRGSFTKLYPAVGADSLKALIDELSVKIVSANSVNNDMHSSFHKTADLHPLLMAIERFYYRHKVGATAAVNDETVLNSIPVQRQLLPMLSNSNVHNQKSIGDADGQYQSRNSMSTSSNAAGLTSSNSIGSAVAGSAFDCSDGMKTRKANDDLFDAFTPILLSTHQLSHIIALLLAS